MDPKANLEEQLRLADMILDSNENIAERAERLAELVHALDEWVTRGGFLPVRWVAVTRARAFGAQADHAEHPLGYCPGSAHPCSRSRIEPEHSCKVYETRDGARVVAYVEHETEPDSPFCIRCGECTR